MTVTFPYSSAPIRQIKEIQFGVMSPEEIVSGLLTEPAFIDLDGPSFMKGSHGWERLKEMDNSPVSAVVT